MSFRGVYIPLITPFAGDGSVALDAIEGLANGYLDAGCAGLVPLGTTGESTSLDADEKHAIVDLCSRICRERGAQLIVGGGTNNTEATATAGTGANAAAAASTAARVSAPSPSATSPNPSPVAGFVLSKVRPLAAGRH